MLVSRHFRLFQIAMVTPAVMAGLLAIVGCEQESITVEEVPKGVETISEPRASRPPVHTEPHVHIPDESDPLRIWTLPQGWMEVPPTAPMRLATVHYPDESGSIEIAVTSFPGDVGGDLANVNRWRQQSGLEPIEESELESHLNRFSKPGYAIYTLRLDGDSSTMLAATIYGEEADRSWFLKAMTDGETAARMEEDFINFARSFGSNEVGSND